MSDLPTIEEAVDEIGFEWPRNGKLECPKHSDSDASLHLYPDSFYCFSCGATGDGIGLVALYSGEDVRRLLARRGGGRSERRATRGLSKTDVTRAVFRKRRELSYWWFDQISAAYAESYDWALLRAVDLWSEVFQDLDDQILGAGTYDEKLAPYQAEAAIDGLETKLKAALPLEQAEGKRTKDVT